jgi:ATP-binding cassette subfamily B protein
VRSRTHHPLDSSHTLWLMTLLEATPTQKPEPSVPLRRVVALFHGDGARLTLLAFLVSAEAILSVASPFLIRDLLDHAIPNRNTAAITALALGMVIASLGSGVLDVFSASLAARIGQDVMHHLRTAVFAHLQSMSLAFFARTKSGDLLSRIFNDVGGVDQVVTNTMAGIAGNVASLAAIITGVVLLDWRLAGVALIIIPGYLFLSLRLGRKRRRLTRKRARKLSDMTTLVQETLSVRGMMLARTSGAEPELLRRFTEQSKANADLEIGSALVGRWNRATVRTALTVIPALTYWIAGTAIAHGASGASLGTVVAFSSMLNRLVRPAAGLSGVGQSINAARSLFDRIFGILDLPVDIRPGTKQLPSGPGIVELRHVTFRHDESAKPALIDIDLTLQPGRITAVVGETGAGKTTLSQLIPRLVDPTTGTVSIDGMDLKEATSESISERLGVVAQDTFVLHASVADNLRLVRPDATDDDIVRATTAAQIHDLISSLPDGYNTVVGDQGHRFSGGERQRIAIARALLRDPDILILDEATSALDSRTEAAVMTAVVNTERGTTKRGTTRPSTTEPSTAARNRTCLVIAHRLSTVRNADLIAVMHDGRIVECGTHTELVAAGGRYTAMLAAQLRSEDER